MSESSTSFSVLLLERLERLYSHLSEELRVSWIPAKEKIQDSIARASFKSFESPELYFRHERSKEAPLCIASRLEPDLFRVYFNAFSKKVYIDLNAVLVSPCLDDEARHHLLGCEIIRSLLFTDPVLLNEEEKPEVAAEVVVGAPEIILVPTE